MGVFNRREMLTGCRDFLRRLEHIKEIRLEGGHVRGALLTLCCVLSFFRICVTL